MRSRSTQLISRLFSVRQPTITKGIILTLCISVASLLCLSYYANSFSAHSLRARNIPPPQSTVKCRDEGYRTPSPINDHSSPASLRISDKVLLLVETQFTPRAQEIVAILEANRIKYKSEIVSKALPQLTHMDNGRYAVVVFERWESYLKMDTWNRELLDKYCREYNVGMISFASPDEPLVNMQMKGFPLNIHSQLQLQDYELVADSPMLRITRPGEIHHGKLPGTSWTVFQPNHSTYIPIAYAKLKPIVVPEDEIENEINKLHDADDNDDHNGEIDPNSDEIKTPSPFDLNKMAEDRKFTAAILDRGLYDGIRRVLFGYGFKFWLHRLLFLDALSYLSHGKLSVPLDRYVLIDIDDIFVGKPGIRMTVEDVQALVDSQARLGTYIDNFRFNLGFSGKFFKRGTDEENRGDDALLALKDHFWWFPHMHSHLQPHNFDNATELENEMLMNRAFAEEHGLVVNQSYAVAPHHSGVYPVHEPLYDAWRKVWDVHVTSTEEYPHLRHSRHRRGFIHRGTQVLPRQTCGLFTHTIFLDQYPGGRSKLDNSIRGGELFLTFLFNPVLIFMTHLSNYGNDRLALYTFESEVKFLKCWTNLRLKTVRPTELAEIYFNMHPQERDPIWRNPCDDKRHLEIWSKTKSCKRLPSFLVIGPQKTGTSALHTFLSMHPAIQSNLNSPTTFEEVQFFNGKNYYRGLDWYMSFFPEPERTQPNGTQPILFEKSANYFDAELAMERAFALLPKAKLITILIHPAKRAYSWYQHQRAHGDEIAIAYSFYDVVTADDDAPRPLRELRNRCLIPGLYAQHLDSWLDYYHAKQLLILDGEELRTDPAIIMDKVQRFLRMQPHLDYFAKLKYNSKKGFYCMVMENNKTKCLGKGKGRRYPEMSEKATAFLHSYYSKPNLALSKLLSKLGQTIPAWLEDDLRDFK